MIHLVDLYPILWKVYYGSQSVDEEIPGYPNLRDLWIKAALVKYLVCPWKLASGDSTGALWTCDHRDTIIICGDERPYFREQLDGYKGQRQSKPTELASLKEMALKIVDKANMPYLVGSPWEADDWIAMASQVAVASTDQSVAIYTCDQDLMQLISDRVYWVNTMPYKPIVRTLANWRDAYNSPLFLGSPREIILDKAIRGDSSDNLPRGTNPEWIDLFNVPVGMRTLRKKAMKTVTLPNVGDDTANYREELARASTQFTSLAYQLDVRVP